MPVWESSHFVRPGLPLTLVRSQLSFLKIILPIFGEGTAAGYRSEFSLSK